MVCAKSLTVAGAVFQELVVLDVEPLSDVDDLGNSLQALR